MPPEADNGGPSVEVMTLLTADGASVEDARRELADIFRIYAACNALFDELDTIDTDPEMSPLNKGGYQFAKVLLFLGEISPLLKRSVHQPLLELFFAVHDVTQGGKPPLIFDVDWSARDAVKSRDRIKYMVRGVFAAVADVLVSANMTRDEVVAWWGRPDEANRALDWRDEINSKTRPAPPAQVAMFNSLRPDIRQPISRADAEKSAARWRTSAREQDPGW